MRISVQVPKRLSSLDELELDSEELLTLQALFDSVMESIESCNLFDSLDEVFMFNCLFIFLLYIIYSIVLSEY